MAHRIFDDQLKLAPTDWSGDMRLKADSLQKIGRAAVAKLEASRVPNTRPSLALDKYAGTYSDSMYGDVTIRATNGRLTLNYAGVSDGVLEHWHYDTFRTVWTNRLLGKSMVTFVIDATAEVAEMKIENLADFKRVVAKADTATRGGQGAEADAATGVGARSSVLAPFPVRPPSAARATSRSLPTGWR
jgi:hypothetical protein